MESQVRLLLIWMIVSGQACVLMGVPVEQRPGGGRGRTGMERAVWQSLVLEAVGVCPQLQRRVSEEARLAAVQLAILDGLGLDERPPLPEIPTPMLPPPLATPPNSLYRVLDRLVLPPNDTECSEDGEGTNLRLTYSFQYHNLKMKILSTAKLLLYTGCFEDSSEFSEPLVLSYESSVSDCSNSTYPELTTTFSGSKFVSGEWVEINLKSPMIRLLRKGTECAEVNLRISGLPRISCAVHSLPESKPYLAIEYENDQKERRKRGRECADNYSECCRDDFFISFKEIHWDQFVAFPRKYNAYICRGNCFNSTAVPLSGSIHSNNLNMVRLGNRTDIPMSCCAPTKLGGDRFIVNYPNGSSIYSFIDNIIVKSCGCH